MKKSSLIPLLLFCFIGLKAQYYQGYSCAVIKDFKQFQYPFTGGFDAPQFTEFDFNNDGLMDIYVFDRSGAVSMVFLRNEEDLKYPFNYSKFYNRFFPKELEGFATVKDFNKDGVVDIFSSSSGIGAAGISLYQGSAQSGALNFELRRMGRPEGNPDILWNQLPAGQVYNASTDIPSIIDVDKDGDLDVLTFDEAGSYVYFCKNYQIEKMLPSDTMDFTIEDYCYGKFLESGVNQVITLSTNENVCASKLQDETDDLSLKTGLHSGSTVMAFDPDGDNDLDLILGDLTYNGLVYLENGGSVDKAFMTDIDSAFPSYDQSVDMPVFLSAFNLDIDGDGLKDIIASPNAVSSVKNTDNIWYYQNNGNSTEPFSLVQRNYLTEETLDFGSYSVPAFVDYNQDGLMDIIVGSGGEFDGIETIMKLVLMENQGTVSNPVFRIIDEDYLDFSEFANTSMNPSPCFGDIDNDGDLDMIIGDEAGKLYYFENNAGPGETMQFANPVYNWMNISTGQRIKPSLFDYNGDGLLDLIIGERNTNGVNHPVTGEFVSGSLNYYQNQGSLSEPFFDSNVENSPNYPVLGEMKVNFSVSTSAQSGASPHFFNVGSMTYALVGSRSGRISLYEITSQDPTEVAILLDDRLGGLVEGEYCSPVVYDINNDNLFEILIGNSRGGLAFFRTDLMTTSSSNETFALESSHEIFPNPVVDILNVISNDNADIRSIRVMDMNAKQLLTGYNSSSIDLSSLSPGIYLLELIDQKDRISYHRVLKTK